MNYHRLCPYVHTAMRSRLEDPFHIRRRVLYDYELIYLEEGSFRLTVDGEERICHAGEAILLRPGVPHSLQSLPGVAISQPHVHFDLLYDELSPRITVSFMDRDAMSAEQQAMIRQDILPPSETVLPAPPGLRERLLEVVEQFERSPNSLECQAAMLRLLACVLPAGDSEEAPEQMGIRRRIREIKHYLDHNYMGAITLEQLAAQFSYNKDYIARQFRQTYGIPLIRYYNQLRCQKAQQLLREGHTVTETAERLSFSSLYAFSRFFRQQTGKPPRQYR